MALSGIGNNQYLVPGAAEAFLAAQRELRDRYGITITPNEGWRSIETQQRYYDEYLRGIRAGPVAKPGNSLHHRGIAVDISWSGNYQTVAAVMARYGFRAGVAGDELHFTWQIVDGQDPSRFPIIYGGPSGAGGYQANSGAGGQPAPAGGGGGSPSTLQIGARGSTVTTLQQSLKAAGFDPGPIDGVFGPRTNAAVRAYQASRGLAVDGIVGPRTWGALLGGGARPAAAPAGAPTARAAPAEVQLKSGVWVAANSEAAASAGPGGIIGRRGGSAPITPRAVSAAAAAGAPSSGVKPGTPGAPVSVDPAWVKAQKEAAAAALKQAQDHFVQSLGGAFGLSTDEMQQLHEPVGTLINSVVQARLAQQQVDRMRSLELGDSVVNRMLAPSTPGFDPNAGDIFNAAAQILPRPPEVEGFEF